VVLQVLESPFEKRVTKFLIILFSVFQIFRGIGSKYLPEKPGVPGEAIGTTKPARQIE
jgi:hypothetical protein